MLVDNSETCQCQGAPHRLSVIDGRICRLVTDAARRAHVLLDVADILTEKPTLSETDIIALDVVLEVAREHLREILRWSEQLPNMEREAEPPRQ